MTVESIPTPAASSSPSSPERFEDLQISEPILRALREVNYKSPTPVQSAVFGPVAAGRDVLVQSKTGSGKTAAFALPLLDRVVQAEPKVQALVLCPTRELALQVAGEFQRLGKYKGVSTTAVYGGAAISRQIEELQAGAQIVVGTPGRVLDHLRRGTLDVRGLKAICLDEADEMLSMGFAEELNAILDFVPRKRQGLLFSATVQDDVRRLSRRHFGDPEFISLSTDQVSPDDIAHYAYWILLTNRFREFGRIIEAEKPDGSIVFCNTKDETEQVAGELQRLGYSADFLNGDLEQAARERVLNAFRSGAIKYLVATDVAARGIDVTGVSHVFNFGFPESAEQYVHRTGRTGRAGRRGTAVSIVGPQDVGNLYYLRLTYGIRPIERTLPSAQEERTRREQAQLQLLREAFPAEPSEPMRSLARRLLAHDDAERLLASLLDGALRMLEKTALVPAPQSAPAPAPAKPAAPPPAPPVAEARPRTREREREPRRAPREEPRREENKREEPKREEPVVAKAPVEAPPPPVEAKPAPVAPPPPAPEPPPAPVEVAPPVAEKSEPAPVVEAAAPAEEAVSRAKPERAPRPTDRARRIDVHHGDAMPDESDEVDEGMEELRLAVGRRDGVRAGELARLLREKASLARRDLGRIFVRDRFSLVSVRAELIDAAIAALEGMTLNDRPLAPERGRGAEEEN